MARIAHGDLVVVIPGILGSTLARDGHQTWGYRQIVRNLHHLATRLTDDLALPAGPLADPGAGTDDGTRATGLLTTVGIVPGFWTVDGYDELMTNLRTRFLSDQDAILAFPYDWRQSNEYSARRLQRYVEPAVVARRRTHPDARLILIGHSMGGLVARYYAQCLDAHRLTRRVITIGTPYQGAAKGLSVLANGYVDLGPRRFRLQELVRSLPSVAELLPVYPCWGSRADRVASLETPDAVVPGLPQEALDRALVFHRQIREAISAHTDRRPTYHALVSHRQTTDTWASLNDGHVVTHPLPGFEDGGDGTVPRCSAVPPEWVDDAPATFLAGKHAALQQQRETLNQLHGILTARSQVPQAAMDEIAVDALTHTTTREEWTVRAHSVEGSDSLVLTLLVEDVGSDAGATLVTEMPVRPRGDGSYLAELRLSEPGAYRWTVRTSPAAATPIDHISDVLLCTTEE